MVKSYAAVHMGGELTHFEYELGELGPHDVDIAVANCGICHSDLSMLDNEWGLTQYPFVPGHEVAGTVAAVGEHVKRLKVGDRVGLGWHASYCNGCPTCLGGNHNMCAEAVGTIVGRHGGFADKVRAEETSVIKLPDGVDFGDAGPLFCGGVTVFNPLVQFGISPTDSIGVIGIGGLGHMALQFARAWGCEVTAFTSTEAKQEEARKMGAHHTINSHDAAGIAAAAGQFDLLISTVNVPMDWNAYLGTLKPRGRLHLLGVLTVPLELNMFPLLAQQLSVSSSPVGSPATIGKMLEFCARHNIKPVTEHFPMSKVNDAMEHLRDGNARYRIVLDKD